MSLLQQRDSKVGQKRVGGNVYLDGYASVGSQTCIKATGNLGGNNVPVHSHAKI